MVNAGLNLQKGKSGILAVRMNADGVLAPDSILGRMAY